MPQVQHNSLYSTYAKSSSHRNYCHKQQKVSWPHVCPDNINLQICGEISTRFHCRQKKNMQKNMLTGEKLDEIYVGLEKSPRESLAWPIQNRWVCTSSKETGALHLNKINVVYEVQKRLWSKISVCEMVNSLLVSWRNTHYSCSV